MKRWIKYTSTVLATALVASGAVAQSKNDDAKSKSEKTQEIIIRKNGDKTEKMTIVVDGENITINGKPVNDYKNADVTVLKTDRINGSPRVRTFSRGGNSFNGARLEGLLPASANKAMLGVVTEKADDGAKVTDVTKESGAEKAGLKKEDIITKIGSTKIDDPEDLIKAIRALKPKEKVDITYKRNGKENKTTATLGESKTSAYSFNFNNEDFNFNLPNVPMPPSAPFNISLNRKPRIGMQIQDVEEGKGVTIKDVDDDSPASKAGLKEGDVITQLNGKELVGVDEMRTEIKDIKEGDTLKLSYKRDGKNQTAELKIPKRLKTADL
ncbi:MAG TPA: PDZ domain-containing protein [Segetibacter sp.]|jgi:serine protease Do